MKTSKKYLIGTGIAAAALAVGGTAAFFTSSDSIKNIFTTGTTDIPEDPKAGVDVVEDFRTLGADEVYKIGEQEFKNTNPSRGIKQYDDNSDGGIYGELKTNPEKVLPGELFIKAMRVDSDAEYDQYLRVKVNVLVDGVAVPAAYLADLDVETNTTGWSAGGGGFLYLDKIFEPNTSTNDIVKSVHLKSSAGNWWKNKVITVELEAESIQATTDAWASWSPGLPVPTK